MIEHGNTKDLDDCHPTLRADYILANPPFNLSDWGLDKLKEDVRWKYGLPPAGIFLILAGKNRINVEATNY